MPTARPAAHPDASRERRRDAFRIIPALAGCLIALVLFGAVVRSYWAETAAPFGQVHTLKVVFPAGISGANEPLLAAGKPGSADFLTVKYRDAETAVLAFDAWGTGGPESPPFQLKPGTTHNLSIAMPTLSHARGAAPDKAPLRLVLDGTELLKADVSFHQPAPTEVFFARNPIGGSPAQHFRGRLFNENGRPLVGNTAAQSTVFDRLTRLWRQRAVLLLASLLMCSALALAVARLPLARWIAEMRPAAHGQGARTAPHGAMLVTLLFSALWFTAVITGGTFDLLYPESFGSFYDHQAASVLKGRIDVPAAALANEAFIVDGKTYGYFGITPALLRMPFAVLKLGFGELTRVYMLVYFVTCLVATYALLCQATKSLCGRDAWPSRFAVVLLMVCAGIGSTLLFLGSRGYIYHEAILCGAAFALWSVHFSLRHVAEPSRHWWLAAALCGLFAVHARPPAGLFALFLLGCVALHQLAKGWRPRDWQAMRRHIGIGAVAVVAMLSFSGMSYLKFRTFDGSPLRYSVQYPPERLAKFDGRNFHLVNIPRNFDTYFLSAHVRFERSFPYVYFGRGSKRSFPEAKIDLAEATLAIPFSMPGAFWLAVLGTGCVLLCTPKLRTPILLLLLGVAPMALALLAAIVTSHRYTGDFCAILIALSAYGLAAMDTASRTWRGIVLSAASLLTIASIFMSNALSLQFQGEMVWGVQPEAVDNYRHLQETVDRQLGFKKP